MLKQIQIRESKKLKCVQNVLPVVNLIYFISSKCSRKWNELMFRNMKQDDGPNKRSKTLIE